MTKLITMIRCTVILLLVFSGSTIAADAVKCEKLRWKIVQTGTPAIYRGSVKAGTADVIYIEVRKSNKVIGQSMGFPNPAGTWEIVVYGDRDIKKKYGEKFICAKY